MNCRRAREALAESWETGLPLEAPVRKHLEGCDRCAGVAARAPEILDLVSRMREPDPGPEYWDGFLPGVRRRIQEGNAPRRRPWTPLAALRRWWIPAAAATALLVILLVGTPRRGGASRGSEIEMADIRTRLESTLRSAGDESRRAAAEALPSAEGDLEEEMDAPSWSIEPASDDEETVEEAIGSVTTILSPAPREGLVDMPSLVENLSPAQVQQLMEEIGRAGGRRPVRKAEVKAG